MKINFLIAGFFAILASTGCKKINYYPDKPLNLENPRLIAHRGGRNALYRENTLAGIHAALRQGFDIEIDVQISKNESIWLSHSSEVLSCNQGFKCFPETTDAELRTITTCNGVDISYTELEAVYRLMRDSFPHAVLCIDLKGWMPCSGNSLDIEGMLRLESESIIKLAEKYNLVKNTLIETETASVLNYAKKINPAVGTYQISYGDFEKGLLVCLKGDFTGLSFKTNLKDQLDKDMIDLLHRKGLKMMVWNLSDKSEAQKYIAMGVDLIQIDL